MDLASSTREEAEQVGSKERPRVRNVVALLQVGETAREGAVSRRPPADARFTCNFNNFHRVRTPLTSPALGSHRPLRFAYTVFPRSGLIITTGIPHLQAVARSARVFRREYNSAGETTAKEDDEEGEEEEEDGFFSARPHVVKLTFWGRVRCAGNVLLRLHQLYARGCLLEDVQVSFRSQCFPGARLLCAHQDGGGIYQYLLTKPNQFPPAHHNIHQSTPEGERRAVFSISIQYSTKIQRKKK